MSDYQQESRCAAIIVTHNSKKFIHKAIACLREQTRAPKQILVVDTGSVDQAYLDRYRESVDVNVIDAGGNVGFCVGNNIAYRNLDQDIQYVAFINPDAFLGERFLEDASALMGSTAFSDVAAITAPLLGYAIDKDSPTGLYDSTGIFRTWYGRWYDRLQGVPIDTQQMTEVEDLPAICGALMYCRREALNDVAIDGSDVFDPSFFMYKEDIDLSLRLRSAGWRLCLAPQLSAFHCRGWSRDRKHVPRELRLTAARNDCRVSQRVSAVCQVYAKTKLLAVKLLDI